MSRIKDTDPGPPFAIEVSANRVGESSVYKVTGLMRNDGSQPYEAVGMNATFFDDEGFRHGPLNVDVPFLLLMPGESTPFSIEIAARRVQSFLLHPEGRPTGRESAPVAQGRSRRRGAAGRQRSDCEPRIDLRAAGRHYAERMGAL
jgi:hypothetical protein